MHAERRRRPLPAGLAVVSHRVRPTARVATAREAYGLSHGDVFDPLTLLHVGIHCGTEGRRLVVAKRMVDLLVPVFVGLEDHFLLPASAHTPIFSIKLQSMRILFGIR